MGVMLSDKSDRVLSWEEKRDILRFCPCDSTEVRTVLKRQNVVRHSFEGYSKQGAVGRAGEGSLFGSSDRWQTHRPTDRLDMRWGEMAGWGGIEDSQILSG
jgi:hypothetical protein